MSRSLAPLLLAAGLALAAAGGLTGCASPERRAAAAPPWAPERSAQVVFTAMAFLDTPYRHGGNGSSVGGSAGVGGSNGGDAAAPAREADGFDCSGFTRHVYGRSLGLTLPRTAWDQARAPALLEVGQADLQPGDLVFFNTLQRAYSHVGIYVGQGRFIHAPRPGTRVRLEPMQGPQGRYWTQRFDGARRAAPTGP